jgi:membrane-associated phospholipid phosphatase
MHSILDFFVGFSLGFLITIIALLLSGNRKK